MKCIQTLEGLREREGEAVGKDRTLSHTLIADIGLLVYDGLGDAAANSVLGFKLLLH